MKLAIAQINCMLGDITGNAIKILAYAERAKQQGVTLLLTPELSLCGYPPEDLLLRTEFYRTCDQALHKLAKQIFGITVVIGHPSEVNGKRYNSASVVCDGKIISTYHKHELPNHSVFDEKRYFTPGDTPCVFEVEGIKFALSICADIWKDRAAQNAYESGAQILLVQNASPYHVNKQALRHQAIRDRIDESKLAIIYVNMVGGQDELVFDGASFAMDERGALTHQFIAFEETLGLIEINNGRIMAGEKVLLGSQEESVYRALCLGVQDYIRKNGFPGVLLGLSGGIDSALTLAIAVDALGASKVHAVMMPSPYTAQISLTDAREMAATLGVRYDELNIEPIFNAHLATLNNTFNGLTPDVTEENLQARLRGVLLMALSNKTGRILLTTGNKSEVAVGYCTLYGDMCGGFAVIKDVPKTLVYRLAAYRNTISPIIPQRVIDRPPSAELAPGQTDQDNLPPYDDLDAMIAAYVEQDKSLSEIVAMGYAEATVRRVLNLIDLNEYKRRQSAVGPKITARNFGKDRRNPITSALRKQR